MTTTSAVIESLNSGLFENLKLFIVTLLLAVPLGLLITLGITDVSYGEWFRYSWKFQLLNLLLTSGILLFGLAVGY